MSEWHDLHYVWNYHSTWYEDKVRAETRKEFLLQVENVGSLDYCDVCSVHGKKWDDVGYILQVGR